MAGWESASVGWASTTDGWESGFTASGTRRGRFMGFNAWPNADVTPFIASRKCRYQAFGVEVPTYLSDPNNVADAGTLDLTDYIADIDRVHASSVDGTPLAAIPKLMGVPREVNPFAGSADPWSSGLWHWYALDGAGRTQMASYAASFAAELDPSLGDMIEIGNESNVNSFNHDGQVASGNLGAGPELVGPMYAEQILAIRSGSPDLPIVLGSIANYGDIANPADSQRTGPGWLARLLLAEPRLLTTAKPDYFGYHPYTGLLPPQQGWAVVNGESANTGGAGWGMPQMIQFRDMLRYFGATNPDGDPAQIAVMEYGTYYTGTGFSEQLQLQYLQQYISAFDLFREEGWVAGPEVHYTCFTDGSPGSDGVLSIYEESVPHNPRPAGVYFDFVAAYDPGTVTVPPVDAPVQPIEPLTPVIEIGIPPLSTSNPYTFVLDNLTRGQLDGAYLLDERFDWLPVTGDVDGVSISRGRDQSTDSTEAGSCTVTIRNDRGTTAGDYDFFNWASPMFPHLNPRSRVRVKLDGTLLFTGDITEFDVNDEADDRVVTTIYAVDPIGRLSRRLRYKPEAEHNAGERLHRILERAKVIDPEFLADGIATFQEGTRVTQPAIDWCNEVAHADGGLFYANAQGVYVYLDRGFLRDSESLVTFTDEAGTGEVRYSGIVRQNGMVNLYNSVTITGIEDNSEPVSRNDSKSQQLYGVREYDLTLPISSELGRGYRAQQILDDYRNPRPIFHEVTIPTSRYRLSQRRAEILGIDIGTTVTIERTPPGDIAPAVQTQDLVVIGVAHQINGTHDASATFTLAAKPA